MYTFVTHMIHQIILPDVFFGAELEVYYIFLGSFFLGAFCWNILQEYPPWHPSLALLFWLVLAPRLHQPCIDLVDRRLDSSVNN